jgi:phosphomannomutase
MSESAGANTARTDEQLRATAAAWLVDEVDSDSHDELEMLLHHANPAIPAAHPERQKLYDAAIELLDEYFGPPLTFGTAGLRGPLQPGPSGMNRTVVRQAAAGLANWLRARGKDGAIVVIGYDARHHSEVFARDSAAVFAAAGFDARLLPRALPTPVLAFAVQHLGAAAGVMVTASHNPKNDNGYKVYVADGAQIAPPVDEEIEEEIRAVTRVRDVALKDDYSVLDDAVVEAYVAAVSSLVSHGKRSLKIVHTAMHGVGTEIAQKVFLAAGFDAPHSVPQQAQPDPEFPSVAFPNPEEPGAMDLALELAGALEADLVLANDPDADRCAVAAPTDDGGRMLRGDEVGVLLADALMRRGVRGTYATTIVSSSMLGAMCAKHGVPFVQTLTGFKYISRAASDLVFGYEEALGYAVAPQLVRDKDGISAALLIADLDAELKAAGSSLVGRLEELYTEYGRYATDQISVRVEQLDEIATMMQRLRAAPPTTLLGSPAAFEDLLPQTDGVRLAWGSGRVVVRPSGTEPKLKAYLEVVLPGATAAEAQEALTTLRGEINAALGI